jgi:calpain-7
MLLPKITGALNSTTAGGNSTFPTWMNNPQYKLHIPPSSNEPEARAQAPAKFIVNLRGARELPLNLTIAWGEGERIFE